MHPEEEKEMEKATLTNSDHNFGKRLNVVPGFFKQQLKMLF